MTCTMCKGPFHPATGHYESEKRMWCGPCARDMYQFLKEQLPRRVRKYRFYDYASTPPPAKLHNYRFSFTNWAIGEKPTPGKDPAIIHRDGSGVNQYDAYNNMYDNSLEGQRLWCWIQLD